MKLSKDSRIYVAGHNGLVGSAIVRALTGRGYHNLILKNHSAVDLTNQLEVFELFNDSLPDYVILAAAKVGNILSYGGMPVDLLLPNLQIQTNIMEAALQYKVKKLIFFGSTSQFEEKASAYAVAKIAGTELCKAISVQHKIPFITIIPPSVYGPNDNYDLNRAHVVAALIRLIHEGKRFNSPKVTLLGDPEAQRDLLYSDDLAYMSLEALSDYNQTNPLIVSSGRLITLGEIAELTRQIVGFKGDLVWSWNENARSPQLFPSGKESETPLFQGLKRTYQDFLERHA